MVECGIDGGREWASEGDLNDSQREMGALMITGLRSA